MKYFDNWSHWKIWKDPGQFELQTSDAKHLPSYTTYNISQTNNGKGEFFYFVIQFFPEDLFSTLGVYRSRKLSVGCRISHVYIISNYHLCKHFDNYTGCIVRVVVTTTKTFFSFMQSQLIILGKSTLNSLFDS